MLNYLTTGYFGASVSLFPQICILLFPNNVKTSTIANGTLGCCPIYF